MKLLVTMNMPSAQEYLVHQMTVDANCDSLESFLKRLNDEIFIQVRLYYKRKNHMTGETTWEDRGDIILNTAHIGKVQIYYEMEKDQTNDEPYGNSDNRRPHAERTRPTVRLR